MATIIEPRKGDIIRVGGKDWRIDQIVHYRHTFAFGQACRNCGMSVIANADRYPCAAPAFQMTPANAVPTDPTHDVPLRGGLRMSMFAKAGAA